jgi:hypothetical protein
MQPEMASSHLLIGYISTHRGALSNLRNSLGIAPIHFEKLLTKLAHKLRASTLLAERFKSRSRHFFSQPFLQAGNPYSY